MSTWWIAESDLDEDQIRVIEEPDLNDSFILLGPPGSGKTNLLLLRARYLQLRNRPDFKIIVFTKQLRTFVKRGAERYEVDPDRVLTARQFLHRLLREHGITVAQVGDFESVEARYEQQARDLRARETLDSVVQTLFVDEVQDYTPSKFDLLRSFSPVTAAAGDERQTIHVATHSIEHAKNVLGKQFQLKYHYRIGQAICEVADALQSDSSSNAGRISSASKYKEERMKSSVECFREPTFEAQCARVIDHLRGQLELYRGELIGVLTPRIDARNQFWEIVQQSDLADQVGLQNEDDDFRAKPVLVSTISSAKGLEFRAVHLVGAEDFSRCGPNHRNLCYTAVTRAKTSLRVYYSGSIQGYLEAALATQRPPAAPISVASLFKSGAK